MQTKYKAGKAPARTVSPMNAGTRRAEIFKKVAAGNRTFDRIARELRIDADLVRSNVYCLHRDHGIGYGILPDGKVQARLPKGIKAASLVV